jgi:hypothetical protein
VRVVDFDVLKNNDWLVVNQLTVSEGGYNRRPDVVVFLNPERLAHRRHRAEESRERERDHLERFGGTDSSIAMILEPPMASYCSPAQTRARFQYLVRLFPKQLIRGLLLWPWLPEANMSKILAAITMMATLLTVGCSDSESCESGSCRTGGSTADDCPAVPDELQKVVAATNTDTYSFSFVTLGEVHSAPPLGVATCTDLGSVIEVTRQSTVDGVVDEIVKLDIQFGGDRFTLDDLKETADVSISDDLDTLGIPRGPITLSRRVGDYDRGLTLLDDALQTTWTVSVTQKGQINVAGYWARVE